jgi:hypothetical protein
VDVLVVVEIVRKACLDVPGLSVTLGGLSVETVGGAVAVELSIEIEERRFTVSVKPKLVKFTLNLLVSPW